MSQVVAFFDLDRTLIDVNSAVLYAKYERKHKRISNWQMVVALTYSTLYHLNLLDMELAYGKALAHYKGTSERLVDENTRSFFLSEVRDRIQPGALEALELHRQQGHLLVLLSTSSSYQAKIASETWGLDDYIANRFPAGDNGLLTGDFAKPLCYGEGKVTLAKRWIQGRGVDLKDCFFYSDSYSDLPMLQNVGNPRVVNPDPKLRSYAKSIGWRILDWQQGAAILGREQTKPA